jgi:hypothetical protein
MENGTTSRHVCAQPPVIENIAWNHLCPGADEFACGIRAARQHPHGHPPGTQRQYEMMAEESRAPGHQHRV